MSDTLLQVEDISVTFPGSPPAKAVDNVCFSLKKGKTLAIVGESGCGKSSLCTTLMGLHNQETMLTGTALYKGISLLEQTEKLWQGIRGAEIAMIFQNPMTALNPTIRIGQQITEILAHHNSLSTKQALLEAIDLLEQVGIDNAKKRVFDYPHTFSGGMRQRVQIAMALAAKPSMIIADEPTTALDVTIQAKILSLLKNLQRQYCLSIIFVTHDLSIIPSIADDVLVMYGGQGVESGKVKKVFPNPQHPYTKALLNSLPQHNQTKQHALTVIQGSPPKPQSLIQGCPFAPRCNKRMRICNTPVPKFTINHEQSCHCWLHHPMAIQS